MCQEKKILFKLDNGEILEFKGDLSKTFPKVIFSMPTLQSVRSGCQAFLASVGLKQYNTKDGRDKSGIRFFRCFFGTVNQNTPS